MRMVKINYRFLTAGILICILLITIFQLKYVSREGRKIGLTKAEVFENVRRYSKQPQTIFISVAAYRDAFCSDTLNFLFERADNPDNIHIGLIDQGSEHIEGGDNIYPDYKFPVSHCYKGLKSNVLKYVNNNVKRIALRADESLGPTYARYLATTLYRNETYFMQIDSHTRFMRGWDTAMINDYWMTVKYAPLGEGGMPRAVLTYYPRSYNSSEPDLPDNDQTQVPRICQGVFNDRGIMTFRSFILRAEPQPTECPFVAAGYFFTSGEALKTVPFDPYLPNLFEGEEILYSARLYEKGFRFYGPTLNYVFHFYTRSGSPKFWEDNKDYYVAMLKSQEKVKYILEWNDGKAPDRSDPKIWTDFDQYTIHNKTALHDYYEHYGISYQNRSHDYNKWCK